MIYKHKELKNGRWKQLTLAEQLANIGSEVERTIIWRNKNNIEYWKGAFFRALELIDLTLEDKKNIKRLREIARIREALVDYFVGDNQYQANDEVWRKYFFHFNYLARKNK